MKNILSEWAKSLPQCALSIQKEDVVFVCEDNKQIIAFAILVKINDQIILDSIAVDTLTSKKGYWQLFYKIY
jgi:hypothetical protein